MATPLTDSINALTAYANEVTGGSDTNLSDAVHTLASGYGGGLKPVKTFVVSESWENDTLGNGANLYNTVFGDLNDGTTNMYFATVENNTCQYINYAVNGAYVRFQDGNIVDSQYFRNNWANLRGMYNQSSNSAWMSQGTVIKVYSLR